MNKYTVMLTSILHTAGKTGFTDSTTIADLLTDHFDFGNWIDAISTFELFTAREIPDELAADGEKTLEEFCTAVKRLPEILEENYQEFVEIKSRMFQAASDEVHFELEGTGNEQEKRRLKEIAESVDRERKAFLKRVFGKSG